MYRTVRLTSLASRVLMLAVPLAPGALAQQQVALLCCETGSEGLCCEGQWIGPIDLEISCGPSGPSCMGAQGQSTLCSGSSDEIAHAILIPAETPGGDALRGKVMLWTACDYATERGTDGYLCHIWDPNDPFGLVDGNKIDFSYPISAAAKNGSGGSDDDGVFCSGHTWILDENNLPKLLAVGGTDRGAVTACKEQHALLGLPAGEQPVCGLNTAYWFDPLNPAWTADPPDLADGRGGVGTLHEGLWYPTVTTYYDSLANKFHPIVLGGSGMVITELASGTVYDGGCGVFAPYSIRWSYDTWWTLTPNASGGYGVGAQWATHSSPRNWQMYPRAFWIDEGSPTGSLMSVGGANICEDPLPGHGTIPLASVNADYGGNPVDTVDVSSQAWAAGEDPNASLMTGRVGGWHYSNAVLLHTLNSAGTGWNKNRIIAMGGAEEFKDEVPAPADPYDTVVNDEVLEYRGQGLGWKVKTTMPEPRLFSNLVPLPDGSIFLVGGQNRQSGTPVTFSSQPWRFLPGLPTSMGQWIPTAERPNGVMFQDPTGLIEVPIPRGYHSTGILLPNGSVALFGGTEHGGLHIDRGLGDTVEIYNPPYMFENQRLKIQGALSSGTRTYGESVCLNANRPSDVAYACLMGVAAATHHFDYGQRYIELPVTWGGCSGFDLEVSMPPGPGMAPEGLYLLFLVEIRSGVPIPSIQSRFIKLVSQ